MGRVPFLLASAVNGNGPVFRFSGVLGAPSFAMALSAISSALSGQTAADRRRQPPTSADPYKIYVRKVVNKSPKIDPILGVTSFALRA